MTNWKEYRLGDVCTKIGSGSTPRGGGDTYLDEGEFALVRSQNVLDFKFSYNGLAYIDTDQADKLRNVSLEERDILLNITGDSVARVCQIPSTLIPARVNQHVAIIRPDQKILNPEFLKYYLLNPSFKEHMLMLSSSGATRNAITKSMIEDFKILAPDIETQSEIAEILSSLDDKIELNNQINKNLEALAQALFKQWFIDFEFPNENSQPYKSSGGEMMESELGEIPKGWVHGKLGSLVKIVNGYAFKSKDFQETGEHSILKIRNVNGSIVDIKNTQFVSAEIASTIQTKFKVKGGDILIAMTGAEVGKIGIVPKTNRNLWLNQRVGRFEPIISNSSVFIYTMFNVMNYTNEVRNSAMGSAQPNISSNGIEDIKCLLPSNEVIAEFSKALNDNFIMLIENLYENESLERLRDELLPKLISGELEVSESLTESVM